MAISIRNTAVEQLARQLAEREGGTMTEAILSALEERRERMSQAAAARAQRFLSIGARCAVLPDLDARTFDEILGYDEHGSFSW